MPKNLAWLIAPCALLLAFPQVGLAQWNKDYVRAKKLYEEGRYAEARNMLTSVVSANPTPSLRGNLGGRRSQTYVPQLYLGLSSAALGDCPGALAQLRNPDLGEVVSQLTDESKLWRAAIEKCDRAVAVTQPTTEPKPDIATAAPPESREPTTTDAPPASTSPPPQTQSVTSPPPVLVSQPAPMIPADPTPAAKSSGDAELWRIESVQIRGLLKRYLTEASGELALPPPETFRSVRARQWRALIAAFDLAGLGMLSPAQSIERERLLGLAQRQYQEAVALGVLPPHQGLCSPELLRIIQP